ncbi:wax ester/triacylglycerol synthase domain-containing protein [Streptomyces sp. SudanB182_2057]|uniref:wax ester/triacylglycerol synthase domain-containing protein n=1 Tax=Streptomyces sp. SudanB182_2057 TaxID=3035281 RepID=UPI003F56A90B
MRLSGKEASFLRPGLPGTMGTATLYTGKPFGLAELRSRVGERWGGLERMHQILRPPSRAAVLSGHRWAFAGPFDPAAHVTACAQDLPSLLAAAAVRRLPADRPPWQLLMPEPAPTGEPSLVLLAHHALLDGGSLAILLRLLMDEADIRVRAPKAAPLLPRPRVPVTDLLGEWQASSGRGQPLPPAPGECRPSVTVARLDAAVMRSARCQPASGRGATLNELLLSALAGALPTCYDTLSTRSCGAAPLYARVPVDLRGPSEAQTLGNLSTAIRVPLPVDTDAPADRLRACQHLLSAVDRRCQAHRAALPVLEGISRTAPWLTTALTRRMLQPDVSTAVCTAFKWRGGPSHLYGRRLTGITALPPLPPPGTVNLDLVQTAETYMLTVVSHLRPGDSRLIADTVAGQLTTLAALSTSTAE